MQRPASTEAASRIWVAFAALIGIAVVARLFSLQWLHPLQWDEVEYFRATSWVWQGRLPYRDFWEHHTPLQWFLFAPVTSLITSPGVGAVVALRWAQVPMWAATFALLFCWMRNANIPRDARWAGASIALGSALFMIPAVEYRIETVGCFALVAGLVLLQRIDRGPLHALLAGAMLCLAGFANIRLGPLLAFAVLLLRFIDPVAARWKSNPRVQWVWAGAAGTLALVLGLAAAAGMLQPMLQHVWTENYLGDRYSSRPPGALLHRLVAPFGLRVLTEGPKFEAAAMDPGGMIILVVGLVALVVALARWRRPDHLFFLAAVHVVSLLFTFRMKAVYVYHFEIVVLLTVPLLAVLIAKTDAWKAAVAGAILAVAFSSFGAVFRGKELDRAYQDLVMRTVHEETQPGGKVFDGVGWALRREPAYRFWFLPELARVLVANGHAPGIDVSRMRADPPAAIVADQNALVWLSRDRAFAEFAFRHYVPLFRNLWIPAMSGVTGNGRALQWVVPRDGTYRVVANPALAQHVWFSTPLRYSSSFGPENRVEAIDLRRQPRQQVDVSVDGNVVDGSAALVLRKGQTLSLASTAAGDVGVFVVPEHAPVVFQQPPPNVSLDAAGRRVTHFPQVGVAFAR